MKKIAKRIAAAVLAVCLAASLCGCDRGYIMTVDGMEIRNGVYLTFQQSAYSKAQTELNNQNSETSADASADDTTSKESVPLTEETIAGVSGSQWIKDETLKAVVRFVAVQRKCEELGIALTDEEQAEINEQVNATWDNEDSYAQYLYGFDTMGEYYESKGIAKESYKQIAQVSKLQQKLFLHYYGEGGEFEIPESEFNEFLTGKYARFKYISAPYTDAEGTKLESDEDKKAVRDDLQKYADRLNNGEKPVDVFYDYLTDQATARAEAQAETKEDFGDLTKDEWIKQQVDSADITKEETDEDLDYVVTKDNTNLETILTDFIFDAEIDGKAKIVAGENAAYLVIKEDITKQNKWLDANREGVMSEMKGEDFQSMLDLFGQNYEKTIDESLVNSKYSPEKLNPKK